MLIHRQVSWDTRWGRQACGHSRINIHTPWAVLSFAVKFLTGVIVLSQPFLTRGTFAGLTTAFLSYPVLFVTRGILLTLGTALRASLPLSCFFFVQAHPVQIVFYAKNKKFAEDKHVFFLSFSSHLHWIMHDIALQLQSKRSWLQCVSCSSAYWEVCAQLSATFVPFIHWRIAF